MMAKASKVAKKLDIGLDLRVEDATCILTWYISLEWILRLLVMRLAQHNSRAQTIEIAILNNSTYV